MLILCVGCCVALARVQHGLRTQCCSSDEENPAAHSSLCLLTNTLSFEYFPGPHSFFLLSLYLLAFSTPLTPSFPVPCQCDPCVVLQQRLAEAAERRNIYRSVRWGWARLLLHTHSSSSITATTAATHRQGDCCTHRHFSHQMWVHKQTTIAVMNSGPFRKGFCKFRHLMWMILEIGRHSPLLKVPLLCVQKLWLFFLLK